MDGQVVIYLRTERCHGLVDLERAGHRPVGIVAVGDGNAEQRHHRIADMAVHRAAEVRHDTVHTVEDAAGGVVKLLGVEQLRQPGIAGEIDVHDGDLASFASGPLRGWLRQCQHQAAAAVAAELGARLVGGSAGRAGDHQFAAAFGAEPPAFAVFRLTGRTRHHRQTPSALFPCPLPFWLMAGRLAITPGRWPLRPEPHSMGPTGRRPCRSSPNQREAP